LDPDEFRISIDGAHRYNQAVFRFSNGYGASVVMSTKTNPNRGPLYQFMSYGDPRDPYELAITDHEGNILYDTPISTDVIGWLCIPKVKAILEEIKNLPKRA
jgi:hypothetical protein